MAHFSRGAPTSPLAWRRLRHLTLDAATHPRGQPHLSAASGLVCAHGRVYVVADDEHHLGVFDSAAAPGRLYRLLPGDLPQQAAERKRCKPDLETLAWLPAGVAGACPALLLLGSGSTPRRDAGVLVPLDAHGGLADLDAPADAAVAAPRRFDLAPLYAPLRARLGALNIEGATWSGDELALFQRGGGGARGANVVACYALGRVLRRLLSPPQTFAGDEAPLHPVALHTCELGSVHGVRYGFTDAAALPAAAGGGWLFTAVAEASDDSIADGACAGAALGRLDALGRVWWQHALRGRPKVEGLALRPRDDGSIDACLVTDADDASRPSHLLMLRLPRALVQGAALPAGSESRLLRPPRGRRTGRTG